MTNHVITLKRWLKTRHHIIVPDDWLEACVEWIQEENQDSTLQFDDLKNQVYEQWLMSDLRELKTPSLPTELTVNRKIEISGIFAVQIDSAKDVGCSFYSQIQKMKGTENPNALVSGEEPKQPSAYEGLSRKIALEKSPLGICFQCNLPATTVWEPKPTRMIILDLSDGVTDVKAMEYKPIAALTPFITPGTKMLIKGPVLCRLGMLMLGPNNVQILGGEVDSLMETNTPENVLATAMQECQTNSGKSERQEFSGRMLSSGEDKKGIATVRQPPSARQPPPIVTQESVKREPTSWNTQDTRGNSHQMGRKSNQPQIKHEAADPDWEDDFDYDALMADMEEETAQQVPRGHNSDRRVKTEPISQQSSRSRSKLPGQPVSINIREEDFMDDFDDDFDIPTSFSKPTVRQIKVEQQSQPSHIQRTSVTYTNKTNPTSDRSLTSDKTGNAFPAQSSMSKSPSSSGVGGHKNILQNRMGQSNQSRIQQPKMGKVFISEKSPSPRMGVQKPGVLSAGNYSVKGAGESSFIDDNDFDEGFEMDSFNVGDVQTPERHTGLAKRFKTDTSGNDQHRNKSLIQADLNNSSCGNKSETDVYTSVKGDVPKAVIHPFSNSSSNQGKTCSTQGRVLNNSGSGLRDRGQSRMDRFLGGSVSNSTASPSRAVPPGDESFTYLSSVLRSLPVTEPKEIVIKGYISTLTSKLTSCQGKVWSLSCKINDGTGALNVDLANSVLTKLIGFSAEDSVVMKHRAKFDPTVKDVLAEGLQQCQQSLTDLSSLMKIQFLPGQTKPVLIQIIPLTANHVQALYDRVTKKCHPNR